jgi:hypothetical protein
MRHSVGTAVGRMSADAGRMTESDVKHAAFRLEHTLRWNPSVPYVRTIHVDPPVTLEEARRMVADNLPSLTRAGAWSLMDGSQLVRGGDIAAVKVVPAGQVPDDHGTGFGLTVIHGE